MLRLQSFIIGNKLCDDEIYFRSNSFLQIDENKIRLTAGEYFSSDTYMNIFDLSAWNQYCILDCLKFIIKLCGEGTVELFQYEKGRKICLQTLFFSTEEAKEYEFFIEKLRGGLIYFRVIAKSWIDFFKAYFSVENIINNVNLAVVICTYHREKEVVRNINSLINSRFWSERDVLAGHMSIHVVDNGSEIKNVWGDKIHVYFNDNQGGAGGFRLGIEEIKKQISEFSVSHTIFMDDDVIFDIETFYRIYALLSIMRQKYMKKMIAGRMMRLDKPYMQYTASEIWNGGYIKHVGNDRDMRQWKNLPEMNAQIGEYSGWWLAVIPFDFVKDNLPLPFFIHCDDVEYGLRNGNGTIVLNGIQVWHETSEKRQSPIMAYYDMRNMAIVNTLLQLPHLKEHLEKIWMDNLLDSEKKHDIKREYMQLLGICDYERGIEWFKSQNPGETHKRLLADKSEKSMIRFINKMKKKRMEKRYDKNIGNYTNLQ